MCNLNIILIRHASIPSRYKFRYIGKTDIHLSSDGYSEAKSLIKLLQITEPVKCFSSPLKRAKDTGEIVASALGLDIDIDSDLCEINFGEWESLTYEEITAKDSRKAAGLLKYDPDFKFPGGEVIGDFFSRVKRAANRMISLNAESVIVFTHGGVIRHMICYFLGLHPKNFLSFDIRPASLTRIKIFSDGVHSNKGFKKQHKGALCEMKHVEQKIKIYKL